MGEKEGGGGEGGGWNLGTQKAVESIRHKRRVVQGEITHCCSHDIDIEG